MSMDRITAPRAILAALDGDEAELGRMLGLMNDRERERLAQAAEHLTDAARNPEEMFEIARLHRQNGWHDPLTGRL